ncbi:MAG: hypothetical protein JWP29_992 [Rhodoferax sp.]|nr:hypothetical protein [Rhodoferax sp.]
MPQQLPAMQDWLPPQQTARASTGSAMGNPGAQPTLPAQPFQASAVRLDIPIATTPKPRALGWLQTLLSGMTSPRTRVSNIQKIMLDELGHVATLPLHEEALARQIVQAPDAETLWELRRPLSEAIGSVYGDLVARQKMTEISFMFAGLLRRRDTEDDHHHPGENVVRLPTRGQPSGT